MRSALILFPDDLNKHAFFAAAVKLAVKNLLPRAEIQLALGYCNHYLPAHNLTFKMRVGIIFAGAIMKVAFGTGVKWGKNLQPALIVLMQAGFVVVYEYGGCYVHCIHKAQALLDLAFCYGLSDLVGYIFEAEAGRNVHSQILGMALHICSKADVYLYREYPI